jgi:guanylate kinase
MAPVITATTRPPRRNEVPGVHYHFYSKSEFEDRIAAGEMLEWAHFSTAMYGTPIDSLQRAFAQGNGRAVQVLEPQGLKSLHAVVAQRGNEPGFKLVPIFMDCPLGIVAHRFMRRYRADLGKALANSPAEIEAVTRYYESRLVSILTVEVEWRREALAAEGPESRPYQLVIDEFGPETEDQVIARIMKSLC